MYLIILFNSIRKFHAFHLSTEVAFSGAPRLQSGHFAGQVELGEVIFETQIYIFYWDLHNIISFQRCLKYL